MTPREQLAGIISRNWPNTPHHDARDDRDLVAEKCRPK